MKIVFLHGLLGNSKDWTTIQELLIQKLKKPIQIQHVDLPGHGKNQGHFNYTCRQDLFDDCLKIWKKSRPDIVVGYSLGGRLALEMQKAYPFAKLIFLESSGLGLPNADECQTRYQLDCQRGKQLSLDREKFLEKWWSTPLFGELNKHPLFAELMQSRIQDPGTYWAKAFELYSPALMPFLLPKLQDIQAQEIHYLYGELDKKYKSLAINIKSLKLPNWKVKSFQNVAHNIHFERPEEFGHYLLNKIDLFNA